MINHDNVINSMLNTTSKINRLHPDILTEDLEESYFKMTGENINKKHMGDAGICYMIGDEKYYYGPIINHPSMRAKPIIAI